MSRIPVTRGTRAINGLYAITPDYSNTQELLRKTRLALEGGASALQYRNKTAPQVLRLEQAQALRELTREFGVPLIINDDVLLAGQVAADGVHLGAADESLATARATLGEGKIIGVSCYNRLSLAREAAEVGANYVAFGAFFQSAIKPEAVTADVGLIRQARALNLPLVAIGGITVANGAMLVQTGVSALAVITALFDAADIRVAAQDFSTLFSQDFAS